MELTIRKDDFIVALYVFGVITAELMGSKTFPIVNVSWLHLNASVAVFVLPLIFTLVDVVIEVHGKRRARSMVLSGLLMVALLVVYATVVTHAPPSQMFEPTAHAYNTVFSYSVRMAIASLSAFATSELLDVFVFAKLRQKLQNRALWFRNNITNFVAQFTDSAVFISLAFYSIHESVANNYSFLFSLIIPYWLIRCSLSILETPLVYLGVWWLRGSKRPTAEPSKA